VRPGRLSPQSAQRAQRLLRLAYVPLAACLLGPTLFHLRGILPPNVFLPVDLAGTIEPWRGEVARPLANWLVSDPLYQYYPFLVHAVDAVRRTGGLPPWNPQILLGQPVIADPLAQPFYPVFLALGFAFGAARGLSVGFWLHAVLATNLTYAWLRALGCRRPSAVLGGFVYGLGGYMVTWFETPFWVGTLAWLPGVLWAFERAVLRRRGRELALGAGAMATAILAGQVQLALTFALFLGLYAVLRAVHREDGRLRWDVWPIAAAGVMVAGGGLAGAIGLLPFVEYLPLTSRPQWEGQPDALPWRQLVTLVVPDFFGNPATDAPYRGALNFAAAATYAGLAPLVLAGLAPWASPRRALARRISLLTLAVAAWVLGAPGVGLVRALPFLGYLSLSRAAFLLPLCIAALAAIALDDARPRRLAVAAALAVPVALVLVALAGDWGEASRHTDELQGPLLRAALLLGATAALLALRHRDRVRPAADVGLVGLVFLDLFVAGAGFNPVGPADALLPPTPGIHALQARGPLSRIATLQRDGVVLFGPNVPSVFGLAEMGGYSSVVPRRYADLVRTDDPEVDVWWMRPNRNMVVVSHPTRRLLDLLAVDALVSASPPGPPVVRAAIEGGACAGVAAISAGRPLSGTFGVRDVAINRLDLPLEADGSGPVRGALEVRLWPADEPRRPVLEAEVDVADSEERPTTFYFEAQRDAPGRSYAWEVRALSLGESTSVGLCVDAAGRPAISVYGPDTAEAYAGELFVTDRLTALPRAYVVHAAELVTGEAAVTARLLDAAFDPWTTAVVESPLDLPATTGRRAARAEIVAYEDARVVLRTSATAPGLVVLADQFHPGWAAKVDGRPASVIRANGVLRGIPVTAGDHEVVFEFAPASLRTGTMASVMGILVLLLVTRRSSPRRRRDINENGS